MAQISEQLNEFRNKTAQFAAGELSVKEYKGFSGKFGSYAQRGAKASMLRLRMAGGRLPLDKLKSIIDISERYNIDKLHCTTCQTIQLHDISLDIIADVLSDAVESGFYTLGGGGDFPRNVMVSPLSGVEKGENFDVFPYAEKAGEYLISQIDAVKMPRKLKVCFSNSPANKVHATFRDLGFVSRSDGKFDVYCCGGMGNNPKMGVLVDELVDGTKILYYIKAMIAFFCKFGNYENRAKARTRYIQDVLGESLKDEFHKELDKALAEGGMDISVSPAEITKPGIKADFDSDLVTEQKQEGLYTVCVHKAGGTLTLADFKELYNTVKDIPETAVRISPDQNMYVINCNGDEVGKVLELSKQWASTPIERSVACIGSEICQQGLRDSQGLLNSILKAVKESDLPGDALPTIHISGCTSSCGTHQIGEIGFHGKVKTVDKKPLPGFSIHLNGCDEQGNERFGEELGVMAADDIPEFLVELGRAVAQSNMSYHEFAKSKNDDLMSIIKKYI